MKDDDSLILGDTLLTVDEVLKQLKISKSTWYAGIRLGLYPKPILIGIRNPRWLKKTIEDFIRGR